jgi:predicted amidohydrolase
MQSRLFMLAVVSVPSSITEGVAASRAPASNDRAQLYSPEASAETEMTRAAIAQLCATADKVANLRNIAQCAGLAQQSGACMLFLPECCAFMGENATQTLQNAEPLDNNIVSNLVEKETENQKMQRDNFRSHLRETVQRFIKGNPDQNDGASEISFDELKPPIMLDALKTIAAESGLWISAGGIHERIKNNEGTGANTAGRERVYNTHIIINEQGDIVAKYRKIHLFDVSIPAQNVELKESNTTAPGNSLVVCDSPVGKLGLTTCYDVRFPEQYTELTQRMGAQVLLVPSAFTVPTGRAHWHILLRARAIETQCHVLAAAQYGAHNTKRASYGHSLAVDPWGAVLADAGGMDTPNDESSGANLATPAIVTCDINLSQTASVRERMPVQSHRDKATFT